MNESDGLRPHHAFFWISCLFAVALFALCRTVYQQPLRAEIKIVEEDIPAPDFRLQDRFGRELACSVQNLDLVCSPNSMWQAHTPEVMAAALAQATQGFFDAEDWLEAFLPDTWDEGFIRVQRELTEVQAGRLERWARTGVLFGQLRDQPLDGLWVEQTPAGQFELCWDPLTVLSMDTRKAQSVERYPQTWSRRLADRVASCLWGDAALQMGADHIQLAEQREAVWDLLMPTRHIVLLEDFDAAWAPDLYWTLIEQGVGHHQMRIERRRERAYAANDVAAVGAWGFLDAEEAQQKVLSDWSLDASQLGLLNAKQSSEFDSKVAEVLSIRWPQSGLELLAGDFLESGLASGSAQVVNNGQYAYKRVRPARRRSRSFFHKSTGADTAPSVRTSLDLDLQRFLQVKLSETLAEHDAAVVMGMVVDLKTRSVLAVDGQSAYPLSGFLPLVHQFTPGSTFKTVVMAMALESGAVEPSSKLSVGEGPLRIAHPDTGRQIRRIREAESPANGDLTATECLVHSSNRGMALIGMRMEDRYMHAKLTQLGYGRRPASGWGTERSGVLPKLPWTLTYTQASLSFGHELFTTYWQHATALAAVLGGGEWRPLNTMLAILQDDPGTGEAGAGESWVAWQAQDPVRVFSPETCAKVRKMMRIGALEGTGRHVASAEMIPDLWVATKTGTAQKVHSEICLHAELHAACSGEVVARKSLVGQRPGHRECYTSSMVAVGFDPYAAQNGQEQRELMVFVVVDEPRGKQKYGSRVAGPVTMEILREALGRTHKGRAPVQDMISGFRSSEGRAANRSLQPWNEPSWEQPEASDQWRSEFDNGSGREFEFSDTGSSQVFNTESR